VRSTPTRWSGFLHLPPVLAGRTAVAGEPENPACDDNSGALRGVVRQGLAPTGGGMATGTGSWWPGGGGEGRGD
jgi:hypothetical protein